MKLSQIRHFVAVVQGGGLQAGADSLGVSPSALLRSIRSLEGELGTALFERGRTPMLLTTAGEIFARRVTAAQSELNRAVREISHAVRREAR